MNPAIWTALVSAQNVMRISSMNASRKAENAVTYATNEGGEINGLIVVAVLGIFFTALAIITFIYFWRNK